MKSVALMLAVAAAMLSLSAQSAPANDLLGIRGVWATADNRCEDPDVATHIMPDRIVFIGNYAEGACTPTSIRKSGNTYVIKAR